MTRPFNQNRRFNLGGSLNRRNFLVGSAGVLALPLMDSLRASAAPGAPPKRLVLFYNPNGTVPKNWFPLEGSTQDNFELGKIHAPLAAYKSELNILKGVHSSVAQDPANLGGPHQRGIGSLFTGEMLLEGDFKDGCGKSAGWANGISIDQLVGNHIGTTTPFRSLEIGVRANQSDVQARISYAGPGAPLPPTNDPVEVYERLFMRAEPLDPNDPNSRRQSVIDTVKDQFNKLNAQVGQEDREKLGKHLALVEDLERRLGLQGGGSNSCSPPAAPSALTVDSEETMPEVSRAHLDLLAAAFACDLTRVASVQYSTGFNRIRYPWTDDQGEGHSLSHSGDSNIEAWDALTSRATWHAGEIAYFLNKLAEIPEGEGTVRDSTLVIWASEVSQGNSHSLNDIPYLLVGTLGGTLRGGQFLTYESASNCDLLHAVLQGYGIEQERFGHPEHASGVLSGLLT